MTDYSELIYRLNNTAPNVLKEREAADAIKAQAKQIVELEAAVLVAQDNAAEYVRRIKDARIAELEAENVKLRRGGRLRKRRRMGRRFMGLLAKT